MKDLTQAQQLANFTGLVLFSAPWCAPCRTYKPTLAQWCEARAVDLLAVNVDDFRELASQFGVRSVPTTVRLKQGRPVLTFSGAKTDAALTAVLGA